MKGFLVLAMLLSVALVQATQGQKVQPFAAQYKTIVARFSLMVKRIDDTPEKITGLLTQVNEARDLLKACDALLAAKGDGFFEGLPANGDKKLRAFQLGRASLRSVAAYCESVAVIICSAGQPDGGDDEMNNARANCEFQRVSFEKMDALFNKLLALPGT